MGLQLYNIQSAVPVLQLHVSLLLPYLESKDEQRATEARLFKSNTGYLGFIGDWTKACVRGFSPPSVLPLVQLCYRCIPCAAGCCARCHIKDTA